ncbi:MAG: hypothetical protein NT018_01040 [Armatimonadetes bacterium]|nr:hypothetical protein [Armatimonadota bacterium]
MLFRGKLCVTAAVILAVISGTAWAEFKPKVSTDAGALLINGKPAARFLTTNGLLPPADRAALAATRLKALIDAGLSAKSLYVKSRGSAGRIYAGETFICVATAKDAKENGTSAIALANIWVSNMKSLIALPPIKLSDSSILVPLGENRSVTVGGAAGGPISVIAADEDVAQVTANDYDRNIQITGLKTGATQLEVSVEGETVMLLVTVRKYAGKVGNMAFAEVTGNPCPSSTVGYAAVQAASRLAVHEAGAMVRIGSVDVNGGALGRSRSRQVDVNITVSGVGYIPSTSKTVVQVNNSLMPSETVRQLFYSNNPERLLKYQTLFAGKLELDKSTRLLFHHQNDMGKRAHFIVDIINTGSTPAMFRVFRGVSSPSINTVLVGYMATTAFMTDYKNEVSVIETVPPQSRLVLVAHKLKHNETISGVVEIRQMSGNPAYVKVVSNPLGLDNVARGDITPSPNPFVASMSEQVYSSPVKNIDTNYIVGRQWVFIPIGKHAVTEASSQKKLYGNYGVTYDINLRIENPTDNTKKVIVAFDPTAGLASGVFMINGALVAIKYAKPPNDYPLVSYQLKPGEERNVNIITIPVAGSNYPATVVVRS